jgi:predicted DNA-binding transcriptional regulator AlpA
MSRKLASNTLSAVKNFDSLPDGALVNFGAVQTLFGRSRPTIYRWVAAGIIPKPAKVSTGAVCWNVGEVRRALAARSGGA